MSNVTRLLEAASAGDRQAAAQILPLVYDELRRLATDYMKQEQPGQTLQGTALVHEAYVRLIGPSAPSHWNGRTHFYNAAAQAMRQILVDAARRRAAEKRGGDRFKLSLEAGQVATTQEPPADDLLDLDQALTRLAAADSIKARLVELRYFAGLTIEEAAETLGISPATAKRYWIYARSWLYGELYAGRDHSGQEL